MPELPEVETVIRTLEKQIKDQKIVAVKVIYPNVIAYPAAKTFQKKIIDQKFLGFDRRGKYLIFHLDDHDLIVHLRMEGKFYLLDHSDSYDKHIHIVFTLYNGKDLCYHDVRKFGRIYLYAKNEDKSCLQGLGHEFFDEEMTADHLYDLTRKLHVTLKQLLLDQHYILGVGNIYADEICFALGYHPKEKVNELSKEDYSRLIKIGKKILSAAIKAGGTTIRSYTSSLGISGRFQLSLKVHGKENEACPLCLTKILKDKVAGRGTYYCPNCQRMKYQLTALTGRRGSGKSTVLALLKKQGFSCLDADKVVDSILKKEEVLKDVEKILSITFNKDHLNNKKKIAAIIFNDEGLKKKYLDYLYPLVIKEIFNKQKGFTVIEVQRLFEEGLEKHFDFSVAVSCEPSITKERLIKKGISREDILLRDKFQAHNKWLVNKANYIVYNNGNRKELEEQVEVLAKVLKGERLC